MPGAEVRQRDAHAHGAFARPAGDAHQAAHALGDGVEARPVGIGPVLAEAGDAGVDQPRVDGAQLVRADAQAVLDVRAVVLDEHVGLPDQRMQDRQPLGLLHVQRQAFLVAVQVLVVGAVVVAPADHVVATGRAGRDLQLDDPRALVGEDAHCRRAGAHAGGVEEGEARQCTGSHSFLPRVLQAGVNMGTAWPSVGVKTTRTRCPIRYCEGSPPTRLVSIVGPSSSVT